MTRVTTLDAKRIREERRTEPAKPARKSRWPRTSVAGLFFVLPAALYIIGFHLVPVGYSLVLSFTSYSPLNRGGPTFVGGQNYTELFQDGEFGSALLVTLEYVLKVLPLLIVLALCLALLVNRPFRGVGVFRSAMYVPHIVSLTAVSMVWLWIYSDTGLINDLLRSLGLPQQSWLLQQDTALNAVAAMRIWKALGSNMVLLLAGLQSIPRELYEAVKVDGGGAIAAFRYVTLPGLRPMLVYVVTMDCIYLAQGFAELFVLTQGGPLGSTTTANYLIYQEAFQYNQMGAASAQAFVLFALIAGLSALSIRSIGGRQK